MARFKVLFLQNLNTETQKLVDIELIEFSKFWETKFIHFYDKMKESPLIFGV